MAEQPLNIYGGGFKVMSTFSEEWVRIEDKLGIIR